MKKLKMNLKLRVSGRRGRPAGFPCKKYYKEEKQLCSTTDADAATTFSLSLYCFAAAEAVRTAAAMTVKAAIAAI